VPWFKVDDKLHDHRKARAAGKAAMGVWVMAGSWASANLTDGFVPATVLSRWGTKKDAERLIEAGFWTATTQKGEPGWRFLNWKGYNPDARTVKLKQEAESAGGTHGNHIRWHKRRHVVDPECKFCTEEQE
jgi:hypothetical protein